MVKITTDNDSFTVFHQEQSSCKRCGEVIEMDVPACPHCKNQPAALTKWGCIMIMFIGMILAVLMTHSLVVYWPGSLIGIIMFCSGVGSYWVVTERYSPTKYDATTRIL